MTASEKGDTAENSRRGVVAAGVMGGLAVAASISAASSQAFAADPGKGLMTPLPPQAPATEGLADLGAVKLW